MAFLILDLVAKSDNKPIGACLSKYLDVVRVPHHLAELGSPDEIPDAFVKIRQPDGAGGVMFLICHANQEGFTVPGAQQPFRWSSFASLLTKFLPHVEVLFLCGCQTAGQETVEAILRAAITVRAVYGTREKIGFPQALYGFLSLLYHMGVRGLSPADAVQLASDHTGVEFAAGLR